MKTNLILSNPADVETECLAVVVLDRTEKNQKDRSDIAVDSSSDAIRNAASDVIASNEASGKIFETTLVHRPAGLKAKRLLLLGGGKAKTFSAFELRRVAGTAVRFLKPRGIRTFAFVAPESFAGPDALRAIAEGAFVVNFDPDVYKSDRKDQQIDAITIVTKGDQAQAQKAVEEGRIIGESQNFTRDLVNEPSNRMTPTILAERAKKMCDEVGLKCEVYGPDKIKELKMGAFWSVAQGS